VKCGLAPIYPFGDDAAVIVLLVYRHVTQQW